MADASPSCENTLGPAATTRLLALHALLASGHPLDAAAFAREHELSTRTVKRDIERLRDFHPGSRRIDRLFTPFIHPARQRMRSQTGRPAEILAPQARSHATVPCRRAKSDGLMPCTRLNTREN